MGLQPNLQKKSKPFLMRECNKCGRTLSFSDYAPTKSSFYPDGVIPICNDCINKFLEDNYFSWDAIDKICQYADIPFVPAEWERIRELNGSNTFLKYAEVFLAAEYENLGWGDYFHEFMRLKEEKNIEKELPELRENKYKKLRERWGKNYDEEALDYLEKLYEGLLSTQNVNGALQGDQALKICKISYEVDQRISEGSDFDKLLASYDKLVKVAEFTPKNVKNINDFDTTGELIKWMEKRGWKNNFYDNVTRDIVDETIKNFQNFNQRLYTNESGIGDEITQRIESLKSAKELENYYDTNQNYDLDNFDNDGYDNLFKNDEFNLDLEDEENEE